MKSRFTPFAVILVVIVAVFSLACAPSLQALPLGADADSAISASAPQADLPAAPNLVDVLSMLATGVGVGAVIAFLFEKFGFFQALSSEAKWWTIFCISIGLPVAARLALQFVPPDVWAQLQPYWETIALAFLTWAGSQAAHRLDHK